jgi:hypothetical protein
VRAGTSAPIGNEATHNIEARASWHDNWFSSDAPSLLAGTGL